MILRLLLATALLALPTIASAQSYLVNIPGVSDQGDFNSYINAVYALFISLAALLAVIKVIVAGVKYMFSDVVTQKSEAKKDIRSSLIGLVIVLAAVLILTIINPNLTRFDLNIEPAPAPAGNPANSAVGSGSFAGLEINDSVYTMQENWTDETARRNCEEIRSTTCDATTVLERPYLCTTGVYNASDRSCLVSAEQQISLYESVELDDTTIDSGQFSDLLADLIRIHGSENVQTYEISLVGFTGDDLDAERERQTAEITAQCNGQGFDSVSVIEIDRSGGADRYEAICINSGDTAGTQASASGASGADDTADSNQNDIPLAELANYDPNTSYTVYDPADPDLGLDAGPTDGNPLTIIGPQREQTIGVRLEDGTELFTGCTTVNPNPCI